MTVSNARGHLHQSFFLGAWSFSLD